MKMYIALLDHYNLQLSVAKHKILYSKQNNKLDYHTIQTHWTHTPRTQQTKNNNTKNKKEKKTNQKELIEYNY